MNHTEKPDLTEQRLRHDLHTIAGTLTNVAPAPRPHVKRRKHHKKMIALGVGAIFAIPAAAGAGILNVGPEYVDKIPQSSIVMEGSVDGSRYLLVESRRTGECGEPVTGVETVEEKKNLIGSEWNTAVTEYGEVKDTDCGYVNDTSRYLKNPALFNEGGLMVGDSFLWMFAVHPEVTTVRITGDDYRKDLKVYEVDGAGYAIFEVPKDMDEYTSELLIGGQVVPGSEELQKLRRW